MVNAEYRHPHFSTDRADKKVIVDKPSHKILRLEYPDGIIVIFNMKAKSVDIKSNYEFVVDEYNVISPRLDRPNKNFKDII